jgi:PTH1 family peptidyl-tRNA hydrolase
MTWLVAGLGNPGERYARTRHNLGAMVADELARGAGERFRKVRFVPVDAVELRVGQERVLAAKSHAFMNESGPSYASLARKQHVPIEQVIAVHDELDLAFGALRVKRGGSTAGHNGLRSLQGALRDPGFLRVRVGIGRPPGRQDPADFVLAVPGKREDAELAVLVAEAAEAVRSLVLEGLERTQDRFNRGAPRSEL